MAKQFEVQNMPPFIGTAQKATIDTGFAGLPGQPAAKPAGAKDIGQVIRDWGGPGPTPVGTDLHPANVEANRQIDADQSAAAATASQKPPFPAGY
jgi:hypothetical protein